MASADVQQSKEPFGFAAELRCNEYLSDLQRKTERHFLWLSEVLAEAKRTFASWVPFICFARNAACSLIMHCVRWSQSVMFVRKLVIRLLTCRLEISFVLWRNVLHFSLRAVFCRPEIQLLPKTPSCKRSRRGRAVSKAVSSEDDDGPSTKRTRWERLTCLSQPFGFHPRCCLSWTCATAAFSTQIYNFITHHSQRTLSHWGQVLKLLQKGKENQSARTAREHWCGWQRRQYAQFGVNGGWLIV